MPRLSVFPRTASFCARVVRALAARRVSWRRAVRGFEAFLELTLVVLAIRWAAARVLSRARVEASAEPGAAAEELLTALAGVARHHPLAPNCLHRSIALQRMLARRGVATTLRVGIGRRPDFLPGHAWLEAGGRVLNDHPDVVARYEPLVISSDALALAYS